MKLKHQFDFQTASAIISAIELGAYEHVACEAFGVSREAYEQWLEKAEAPRAKKHFKKFKSDIAAAKARARMNAEHRCFARDPKAWLRSGPGRETKDNLGWTMPIPKPITHSNQQTINVFGSEQTLEFLNSLRGKLADDPETYSKVIKAIEDKTDD